MEISRPLAFVRAHGQDRLSGLIHNFSALERILMSPPESKSHHSLRWRKARNAFSKDFEWAQFDPTPASVVLASQFNETALIGASRSAIESEQRRSGGKPAVAYALGCYVMYGEIPDDIALSTQPERPDTLMVGMGVGRGGPLLAAIGLRYPETKTFIIPAGAIPEELGVYPNSEFPSDIPRF